jgi:hypothetical protein
VASQSENPFFRPKGNRLTCGHALAGRLVCVKVASSDQLSSTASTGGRGDYLGTGQSDKG